MTRRLAIRAALRAEDRADSFTAGLIYDLVAEMSGRDLDRTIAEMTDAEIEALVTPSPIAAALPQGVDQSHDASCTRPGRESC
jgi:hypothetical protein